MSTVRRIAAVLAASAVLCTGFVPGAAAAGHQPLRSPGGPLAVEAAGAPSATFSALPPAGPSDTAPTASAVPAAGITAPDLPVSPSASARPPSPPPLSARVAQVGVRTASAPAGTQQLGLYGSEDPSHDGVWRQSLAMLAQYVAGLRPTNDAVRWLKHQQCADGSFPAYRAVPAPCGPAAKSDVRATAAAVQALWSIGGQRAWMQQAVAWLRFVQNPDGGWGQYPGSPTDATSTSLVIGALASAQTRPSSLRSSTGKSPYQALAAMSLPCGTGTGGAFTERIEPPGRQVASDQATIAGLIGGIGKRLVVSPVTPGPAPVCPRNGDRTPERIARNGASYLAAALAKTGHLDSPAQPGSSTVVPDPGETAQAVLALTAAGYRNQASGALEWLKHNSAAWAEKTGPAGYAQLILTAYTTGTNPRDFGGIDLVRQLNAMGPAPSVLPSPAPTSGVVVPVAASGGGTAKLWIVVALTVCAAIGILVGNRRQKRRR